MIHIENLKVKLFLALVFLLSTDYAGAQPSFGMGFSPSTIGPGTSTEVSFVINNQSGVLVTDLSFSNTLPSGISLAEPANANTTCDRAILSAPDGGSAISFSEGTLAPFSFCTVTVNVTVTVTGNLDTSYTNVSSDLTSSAGNSGNATSTLDVLASRPILTKTFSPNKFGFSEAFSTLTFTVDNSLVGVNAINLSFTDPLPEGMRVADASNLTTTCLGTVTAEPGSSSISFFSGFLMPGEMCTITVDVMVEPFVGQKINVTSVLNSSNGGSGFATDAVVMNQINGELLLAQRFLPGFTSAGGTVDLEFSITNFNRTDQATAISFTNDLDATLSGMVATNLPLNDVCGMGSVVNGSSAITFSGGVLPPEGSCDFVVSLQIPANATAGTYQNITSAVSSAESFGDPSTRPLTVSSAPSLSKTFLTGTIGAGDTTTMEFTISNTSTTSAATDIAFQDNISGFLSGAVLSALPASGFCGGGSIAFVANNSGQNIFTVSGANLAAGEDCTFSADLTVPVNTPTGDYLNETNAITATVDGLAQQGVIASDVLSVVTGPDFSVEFIDDPVMPGDVINARVSISLAENSPGEASAMNFTWDLGATLNGLTALNLPLNDVCGLGSSVSGAGLITFTGGNIQPATSCEFDISMQVPASAAPGSYMSITSVLSATTAGLSTSSSAGQDELVIGGLTFSHQFLDDPVISGAAVTLEFTIENNSIFDSTGMVFTHNMNQILPGLVSTDGTLSGICGSGSSLSGTSVLIFVGGNLLAGESCTFQVALQTPVSSADGQYNSLTSNLSATINASSAVIAASSSTLVVDSELIGFAMAFLDSPHSPGDVVSLQYSLQNLSGTEALSNLSFTHDLSVTIGGLVASVTPVNDVCGAGSVISGTEVLAFTSGQLAAGESCEFIVTMQLPMDANGGTYPSTTAAVNGSINGLSVFGSPATADLQIFPLSLSFTFDNPTDAGRTTVVSYSIENLSDQTIEGFRFGHALQLVTADYEVIGGIPQNPCGEGSNFIAGETLSLENASLSGNSSCQFSLTVRLSEQQSFGVFSSEIGGLLANGEMLSASSSADLVVSGELAVRAARVADYWFENTLSSVIPGAPDLVYNGSLDYLSDEVLGMSKTVLPFDAGEGFSLGVDGLVLDDEYTIAMLLQIDDANGYVKLIDFNDLAGDAGLYNFNSALNFEAVSGAVGPVNSVIGDEYFQVILSRSGAGQLSGYVNGVLQFTATDTNNKAVIDNAATIMRFMIDDIVSTGLENSAGDFARLTLFDVPFKQPEVSQFPALEDIIYFNGFD